MSSPRPRRRLREWETGAYVLHDYVKAGDPVARNKEQCVVDIGDGIDVADLASSEEGEGGAVGLSECCSHNGCCAGAANALY